MLYCVYIGNSKVLKVTFSYVHSVTRIIDQFRYIKIQSKTIDLSTRLVGVNPTSSVVIPTSVVLWSIVLD